MKYFVKNDTPDLMKAGAHKYVKRTGSPGSYKYWYKMPDGTLSAGDDDQSKGRLEHIKRLLISHRSHSGDQGHHAMNHDQIKAHVGAQGKEFQTAKKYADRVKKYSRAGGTQWQGRHFDHDFSADHLGEAHKTSADMAGEADVSRRATASAEAATAAPVEAVRFEGFRLHTDGNGDKVHTKNVTGGLVTIAKVGDRFHISASSQYWDDVRDARAETKEEAQRKADGFARNIEYDRQRARDAEGPATPTPGSPAAEAASPTPAPARTRRPRTPRAAAPAPTEAEAAGTRMDARRASAASRRAAPPVDVAAALGQVAQEAGASNSQSLDKQAGESNEQYQSRLVGMLAEMGGPDFRNAPAPAAEAPPEVVQMPQRERARVAEATARVNREIGPRSEGATALAAAVPEFAVADAPVARMLATEAAGGNPYLARAKEIFHNISHDLESDRKDVVKNMLQAITSMGSAPLTESALLAKYKEITSNTRIRTLPKVEFERGAFISLDEIIENRPVDIEVERMKRGFAAKQFARMKPFLKPAWLTANASAPPPYPTYGDMKSWAEHGTKPDWAGTTRMAVPKEVHDAAHKGADGKPKHPPAWMPIHMAPVWAYVMKKSEGDEAYQTRNVNIANGRLNLSNQSAGQEGIVIGALRKYVQMRGGADQMTDIPSSKLQEVGLTHSDIFKGMKFKTHDHSDETLKKLMAHKIVDPVALIPFLDSEMKSSGMMVKKSFSLVIDEKLNAVDFRKSFVIEDKDLKKALIEKIKRARSEKGLNG